MSKYNEFFPAAIRGDNEPSDKTYPYYQTRSGHMHILTLLLELQENGSRVIITSNIADEFKKEISDLTFAFNTAPDEPLFKGATSIVSQAFALLVSQIKAGNRIPAGSVAGDKRSVRRSSAVKKCIGRLLTTSATSLEKRVNTLTHTCSRS